MSPNASRSQLINEVERLSEEITALRADNQKLTRMSHHAVKLKEENDELQRLVNVFTARAALAAFDGGKK